MTWLGGAVLAGVRVERPLRQALLLALVLALLIVTTIFAAGCGALSISPRTTLEGLIFGLSGDTAHLDTLHGIVWNLRLPRVCLGLVVGASLGTSGAAMQGLFRNPLADPYLLGVASGASLGVAIALTLGGQFDSQLAAEPFAVGSGTHLVPLFAFVGATGAVLATLGLSRAHGRTKTPTVLLSGVVVGSVLTALTTYLMMRDADRARAVLAWTLGNLSGASWASLKGATPYAVAGGVCLFSVARGLDALQLGEDTARSLGVNLRRVRLFVIVGASLATAAAVSFAGIVGFVGLAAPHVMRRLGAVGHRVLLPASALGGALLLVLADLGARTLIRPGELPVGIVTTLLGGPFFLWLLRRRT